MISGDNLEVKSRVVPPEGDFMLNSGLSQAAPQWGEETPTYKKPCDVHAQAVPDNLGLRQYIVTIH